MRQLYIIIALSLLIIPTDMWGGKRNSKHDKNAVGVMQIEPDPVARKTKPDSRPQPIVQPHLSGVSYRQGNALHGIDVSHYQGRIDWTQVAHDKKVGYVYLKATEGSNNIDDTYAYNLREAKRAGLLVGSYHFYRANVSPEVQFRNFMSVVDVKRQDLLPIIDVEAVNGVPMATFHARLEQLLKLVTQAFGRRPIIYTGKNFYNKHMCGGSYRNYQFMIAAYTFDEPMLYNNDDYIIWQYSASGRIRGIRGNVDQSRFVGRHTLKEILF